MMNMLLSLKVTYLIPLLEELELPFMLSIKFCFCSWFYKHLMQVSTALRIFTTLVSIQLMHLSLYTYTYTCPLTHILQCKMHNTQWRQQLSFWISLKKKKINSLHFWDNHSKIELVALSHLEVACCVTASCSRLIQLWKQSSPLRQSIALLVDGFRLALDDVASFCWDSSSL